MKYVLIGKIVNTHALKGELRVLSDFKYKNKVFKKDMKVYIGAYKIAEEINSYRHHKVFEMITLKGYNDINQVLKYKGEYLFVNKEDIKLCENEYLNEDLINLNVYVKDRLLGTVKRIDNHNGNEIIVVKNNDKDYLIPYNFDIIQSIDLEKREMHVVEITGLF